MRSLAKLRILIATGLLGLLAGCGAGGGGGSTTYSISLRADNTALPLNIANVVAGVNQYTTTLYVDAKDSSGNPIPSGTGVFGCNIVGGLFSGSLYYLDGKVAHEIEVPQGTAGATCSGSGSTPTCYVPAPYRAVALDANSGAATFHFESSHWAGTSTIRCSVTDPNGVEHSASTPIKVGDSTGLVSQIVANATSPNYLYVQGYGGDTQLQIQAQVLDEAGQVITPPSGANDVQVRIVPDPTTLADDDALLRGTDASGQTVSGSSIQVQSINGQAQFTLVSGTNPGTVLIEIVSDHADNNVDNGITEPVYNHVAIPVTTSSTSATALAISTTTLPDATGNIPYAVALQATGGTLPYTWQLTAGQLPYGLSLNSSGVISGNPYATTSGTYNFVVQVTGAGGGQTVQQNLSIKYTAATVTTVAAAPTITTSSLSSTTAGDPYAQVLTATGGSQPYTWSVVGPSWLAITTTGILYNSGTTVAGAYPVVVTVTGSDKYYSNKSYTLTVN